MGGTLALRLAAGGGIWRWVVTYIIEGNVGMSGGGARIEAVDNEGKIENVVGREG